MNEEQVICQKTLQRLMLASGITPLSWFSCGPLGLHAPAFSEISAPDEQHPTDTLIQDQSQNCLHWK